VRICLLYTLELINHFGLEVILIWVASLLRKRIFVVASNLSDLFGIVRACPCIGAWHRQNFDILRPYVTMNEVELAELSSTGIYVAGFTDSNAVNRRDLYDILVDVNAKSVTVNEAAKADFVLGKFHKTTAETITAAAQSESDQQIIKVVAAATKTLLDNVSALRVDDGDGRGPLITLSNLQQQKLPANMDKSVILQRS